MDFRYVTPLILVAMIVVSYRLVDGGETALPTDLEVITVDNLYRLQSLATLEQPDDLAPFSDNATTIDFNSDNTLIAATNATDSLWYWRIDDSEITVLKRGHADTMTSLAFSPTDPLYLASCDGLWDTETGKLRYELNTGTCESFAFNSPGTVLATGTPVRLWDVHTGNLIQEYWRRFDTDGMADEGGSGFDMSPDGKVLAYTTDVRSDPDDPERGHSELRLIYVDEKEYSFNLGYRTLGWYDQVKFSPNSKIVAYVEDLNVVLRKIDGLEITRTYLPHGSMEFGVNSDFLAVADDDGIWVYDIEQAEEISLVKGNFDDVAFSFDGTLMATAGENVTIWGVPTADK